jgi:DNA-binding transcriptional regulator LsrR (DeoR family)
MRVHCPSISAARNVCSGSGSVCGEVPDLKNTQIDISRDTRAFSMKRRETTDEQPQLIAVRKRSEKFSKIKSATRGEVLLVLALKDAGRCDAV